MVYRQRMKYAQETFASALTESLPLLSEHWGEIARNRELIPLDPDYDLYHKMEAIGCIRLYTARTDEGALVGYALYFVRPHLHYKQNTWAVSDVIYLHPDHRKGTCGVRLMSFVEKSLAADGVDVMHTTSKLAHPALARVMEHLGHKPIEVGHAKVLSKGA